MHTERPIAKDEADAFDDAVAALDNWPGEDKEPEVVFCGERCTIGTVCNLVALFSDPMPEGYTGFCTRSRLNTTSSHQTITHIRAALSA